MSRALQHGAGADKTSPATNSAIRIPALELEKAVAHGVAALFDDPLSLASRTGIELRPDMIAKLEADTRRIATKLRRRDRGCMRALISKVSVERERILVELGTTAIIEMLGVQAAPEAPESITISIDASMRRTGMAVRLIHENGSAASAVEPQEHLVRLLAKARSWWGEMIESGMSASQLGAHHGVTKTYVSRVIRLNFLAPQVVESIIAGRQPVALDAKRLLALHDLPLAWSEQGDALHLA